MADVYPYQELYDRLRRSGYHEDRDKTSHLLKYVPWLKERTGYQSVLDIGCGAGGSFLELGSEGQTVFGVDVSIVAVDKARKLGRNVVQSSATKLPFPDNHFDLVASADVMEHIHEDDVPAATREAIRVARRHVFMKIATREDVGQPWKTMAGHPLHLTIRPIEWWKQFFRDAGRFIRDEEHVFCLELSKADKIDGTGHSVAIEQAANTSCSEGVLEAAGCDMEYLEVAVTCTVETGMLWPNSSILQCGCDRPTALLVAAIARAQGRRLRVVSSDAMRLEELQYHKAELSVIKQRQWLRMCIASDWGLAIVDSELPLSVRVGLAKQLAARGGVVVMADAGAIERRGMSWQPLARRYRFLHLVKPRIQATAVMSNLVDLEAWFD